MYTRDLSLSLCILSVFHAFIEYIRLLREDCYEFDTLSVEDLDGYMPYSYEEMNTSLDYVMDFSMLCDGSNGEQKRLCSDRDITARLMYDVSPNTLFGVVYELGDFWNDNSELISTCSDSLNSTWWSDADGGSETESSAQFVSDHVLHSVNSFTEETTVGAILFLMISGAAVALLKCYGSMVRQRKITHIDQKAVYGTV